MDLLEPFIFTNFWHWGALTKWFWGGTILGGNTIEHSVYFGIAATLLCFFALFQWRKIPSTARFWLVVLLTFSAFALGPVLKVDGHIFHSIRLPYDVLNHFIPSFRISGMPVRMMVMSMLAAGMVIALVLPTIVERFRWGKLLAVIFAIVLFIDLFPAPYVQTPLVTPGFVNKLKTLPPGAVIDWASGSGQMLYYQTLYNRPAAFGYVSRTPTSVDEKDIALTVKIGSGNFASVCRDDHLRYLVVPLTKIFPQSRPIYQDPSELIYDLKALTGQSGC